MADPAFRQCCYGLIWGRNFVRGDPLERARLTYFTLTMSISWQM